MIHLETGQVLGEHSGIHTLTLGQKARIGGRPTKAYVVWKAHAVNPQTQELEALIYVVDGQSHPALRCEHVYIPQSRFDWIGHVPAGVESADGLRVQTQIRHRQNPLPGTIRLVSRIPPSALPHSEVSDAVQAEQWYQVIFDEPIIGVAPGQVVALWDFDGATLGSGTIQRIYTSWDHQTTASASAP